MNAEMLYTGTQNTRIQVVYSIVTRTNKQLQLKQKLLQTIFKP